MLKKDAGISAKLGHMRASPAELAALMAARKKKMEDDDDDGYYF
jgi:hypothetical protein